MPCFDEYNLQFRSRNLILPPERQEGSCWQEHIDESCRGCLQIWASYLTLAWNCHIALSITGTPSVQTSHTSFNCRPSLRKKLEIVSKIFSNTKKVFKKLHIFILRRFGLFLIHLQSKNKATLGNASNSTVIKTLLKTSKKRRVTFEEFFFTCPTLANHLYN